MDIQHTQYLYERLYQHFEMTSDDEVRRKLDAALFNNQQLAYNASVLAQRYQI